MINVRVTGLDEALRIVQQWRPGLQAAAKAVVERQTNALVRRVKEDKLSGQVLRNRSGQLRRSITGTVEDSPQEITGTVGTNVVYARIHEYGGTVHIPEVRPVRAKALHWANVFAMRARAHDVIMPQRSFLRTALKEQEPEFRKDLAATLQAELGALA